MFITFEGIDGAGKTTQIERLKARLEALGQAVVVTREPGATGLGQKVREIVLHSSEAIAPWAELFLYESDRAQHVAMVIEPALAQGQWVLCDRFIDSTVAYQGYGRGLDVPTLKHLNALATQGRVPDKTIWLDGPVEVLLARAKRRATDTNTAPDRFEAEKRCFFEALQRGFFDLASAEPERFVRVDATQALDTIETIVWDVLEPLFKGGVSTTSKGNL
jgi:dTMP kinase